MFLAFHDSNIKFVCGYSSITSLINYHVIQKKYPELHKNQTNHNIHTIIMYHSYFFHKYILLNKEIN